MNELQQKIVGIFQSTGKFCIVGVDKTITTKQELLSLFRICLRFPDYFGHNWDAFQECIHDLSWMVERDILILHEEFPKISQKDFNIYCEIIKDASDFWKKDGRKNLSVVFL